MTTYKTPSGYILRFDAAVDQFGRPFEALDPASTFAEETNATYEEFAVLPPAGSPQSEGRREVELVEKRTSEELKAGEATVEVKPLTTKEKLRSYAMMHVAHLQKQWFRVLGFLVIIILTVILMHGDWSYMDHMQWYILWCLVMGMGLLSLRISSPDIMLWLIVTLMILHNDTIELRRYYTGMSNESVVTYILITTIFASIEYVGLLDYVLTRYFRPVSNRFVGQFMALLMGCSLSAFFDSQTILQRLIPHVREWSLRSQIPLPQIMLPLSYIVQVGGCLTIIGSFQTMMLRGLGIVSFAKLHIPFFEIGRVAIVLCGIILVYTWLFSKWLLPDRKDSASSDKRDLREYTLAVIVKKSSPTVGKTIEAAGLRNLPGVFLVEIRRNKGEVIPAPAGTVFINAGDRLTFAGDLEKVQTIWKTKGFAPTFSATEEGQEEEKRSLAQDLLNPTRKVIVEVVISMHSPLIGKTVKEAQFRSRYGAAIIAIHRFGHHLTGKIGDTVVEGGDAYLLETTNRFLDKYKDHHHFSLVSEVSESVHTVPNKLKMIVALGGVVTMFAFIALDKWEYGTNALGCVYFLMILQCLPLPVFRKAFRGSLILEMTAPFTILFILRTYAITTQIGIDFVDHFENAWGLLWAVYLFSSVLCILVGPAPTIAMMIVPITRIVRITRFDIRAFLYVIAFATSTSFVSPTFITTNLMVAGPGGYTKWDYVRFGLPLQLMCSAVIVPMIHELYVDRDPAGYF